MPSLQNGRPGFDQVTGQGAWEHLQSNPQTQTIFNQAMRDLSACSRAGFALEQIVPTRSPLSIVVGKPIA